MNLLSNHSFQSPEQFTATDVCIRADIYAFGVHGVAAWVSTPILRLEHL